MNQEKVAEGAARIAILAASGYLPEKWQDTGSLVLDDETRTYEELVMHLAGLPKPIRVQLKVQDERVTISVEYISDPVVLSRRPKMLDFLDETESTIGPDSIVICRRGKKDIEVSLEQFREWERSYVPPAPFSSTSDFADSHYAKVQGFTADARRRAVAVVLFGGPPTRLWTAHFRFV